MDVALVTCARLPDLESDDRWLLEALPSRGVSVGIRIWNDPAVGWGEARLTLLRSPWDYHLQHGAFLAWAENAARVSRLVNPLAVLRWNTDKGYLRELAALGVPVVRTEFLPAGARLRLRELLRGLGWRRAVVKPAVSCDSWGTVALDAASEASMAAAQALLDALLPEREMMLQPYLPGVVDPGERSLVFIEGELSHAVRKGSTPFGGPAGGGSASRVRPAADEVDAARRALEACGQHPLLYARVDLVRDETGGPLLMELELVEPSLFLGLAPEGRERFLDGIVDRLEGRA